MTFDLEWNGEIRPAREEETEELFTRTQEFWQSWISQSRYRGRCREMVHRSAWLRDAAFTVYALMRLGFLEEAASFMDWIQRRCETATAERDVMIMYAVDGSEEIPEQTLDHLEGYQGASPVRIGNGAVGQRQLDVYGELMDSVYIFNREQPISYDLWVNLTKRLDWLASHWEEPDEGVWEIRGPRQRFTYSALMTWVAYDRAGRLARDRGLPAPIADGEGTFNLCSFWYVEALTRAGRVREARMIFEKMLTYAKNS